MPDLIENLALATERLNVAIDRAERYLTLAGPMIRTMDALLPQIESLVATGNDVYRTVSSVPGVSTLSRFTSRGPDAAVGGSVDRRPVRHRGDGDALHRPPPRRQLVHALERGLYE